MSCFIIIIIIFKFIIYVSEQEDSLEQNSSFISSNYFGLHRRQALRTLGLECSPFPTFYFCL